MGSEGLAESMMPDYLDTIVLDTGSCFPAPAKPRPNDPHSQPPAGPRAEFLPFVAQPIASSQQEVGDVTLFLGVGAYQGRAADAALAYLLRAAPDARPSLLVELAPRTRSGPADDRSLEGSTRIAGSAVARTRVVAEAFLLRDWVLFLHDCRASYGATALAGPGGSPPCAKLVQMVDRVLVATTGDPSAVREARNFLRSFRGLGAVRGECLWLDAA